VGGTIRGKVACNRLGLFNISPAKFPRQPDMDPPEAHRFNVEGHPDLLIDRAKAISAFDFCPGGENEPVAGR
jgi:hypothetical protein